MNRVPSAEAPIAVFGGTFDPVHNGHLRSALELAQQLDLGEVRMMPCANPPHRDVPTVSAEHRAAMLDLAVANEPLLSCDRRELRRPGRSYTIDSLLELRAEVGDQRSLSMIIGCDALLGITGWHRWSELLDQAHIIVIARPGWSLPSDGPVAEWIDANGRGGDNALRDRSAGSLLIQEMRPFPVSASEIRALISSGRSARFLLPEPVMDYIWKHQLYKTQ